MFHFCPPLCLPNNNKYEGFSLACGEKKGNNSHIIIITQVINTKSQLARHLNLRRDKKVINLMTTKLLFANIVDNYATTQRLR